MDQRAQLKNIRMSQPAASTQAGSIAPSPRKQIKQQIARKLSSTTRGKSSGSLRKIQASFNQQLQASSAQTLTATATAAAPGEAPDNTHFLNRISYGATPMLREQLIHEGWEVMLEQQLHPENIDTGWLDTALANEFPTLAASAREIYDALMADNTVIGQVIEGLIVATVARQAYSPAQLYERMVEFWSDHFNMNILDDPVWLFKTSDDRDAIRPHALGKFRDLLHANASSPAMILYLDNFSNIKNGPNENYARELMELHTLGVNGGYTEEDVVAVARAFTGWSIDLETLEFTFNMYDHDRRPKTVLGIPLKNTFKGGITDGEQVLDLFASHPSTARFISTKLARRFVGDDPPVELIDELAQVFLATDGDIKELLRTIFYSNAFWNSKEQKMKRPLDFLTSLIRRLGFEPNKDVIYYLLFRLDQLEQIPYFWHAPNGYPDDNGYWTNTSALMTRWSSSNDLGRYIPYQNLEAILGGANTPIKIIQAVALALIDRGLDASERKIIRRNVFAGQLPNQPVEGDPVDYAVVTAMIILASRHFQMR